MTARPQDVALLPPLDPLPEDYKPREWECTHQAATYFYQEGHAAALASAQAREDELRAEVERLTGANEVIANSHRWMSGERDREKARAERLAEALRAAMNEAEGCMFEAWLARTCPGGDVESVHRQWKASSEFEDFLNEWSEASAALSTNAATQTGE